MGSRRFSSNNYLGIKLEDFAALTIEDQKSAEYLFGILSFEILEPEIVYLLPATRISLLWLITWVKKENVRFWL
ncbi:unnamed protein product [Allacma fusca]|uniref:Uncharacterized protein n=1 Tax=Allacma fusca TaxID=39272 RepID=A0A8J2KVV8_9HEXA|nr:unnamed protein product [Allacma fusca]